MLFKKIRFWSVILLLILYIVGILVLTVISLHDTRSVRGGSNINSRYLSKSKSFEYGLPGFRPNLRRSKINWCSELSYLKHPGKAIALASFPGSGNTWLRYLLQQATGYHTGSVYKDYGLLKNGFPAESVYNSSVLVVKTHEWGPSARSQFSKAILLVRTPASAIQAEFNRQSGGHIGFAAPDRYKRMRGRYWQQFVTEKLRGWQTMNLDWLYNFTGPTHVIFYEQLVDNVEHTLRSVIEFIDIPLNKELFDCAIERKEGIYRRKKRVLTFDPYTEKMKSMIKDVQKKVFDAIYNFAAPADSR
uniref:WSCD family member CG9164 n=1 Tax=Diabrotica virgifera virgifera TaxID=50390 RepID=A0A6P7FHA9_DIAVI